MFSTRDSICTSSKVGSLFKTSMALSHSFGSSLGVAGGEGVDESQNFILVCHSDFLLGVVVVIVVVMKKVFEDVHDAYLFALDFLGNRSVPSVSTEYHSFSKREMAGNLYLLQLEVVIQWHQTNAGGMPDGIQAPGIFY